MAKIALGCPVTAFGHALGNSIVYEAHKPKPKNNTGGDKHKLLSDLSTGTDQSPMNNPDNLALVGGGWGNPYDNSVNQHITTDRTITPDAFQREIEKLRKEFGSRVAYDVSYDNDNNIASYHVTVDGEDFSPYLFDQSTMNGFNHSINPSFLDYVANVEGTNTIPNIIITPESSIQLEIPDMSFMLDAALMPTVAAIATVETGLTLATGMIGQLTSGYAMMATGDDGFRQYLQQEMTYQPRTDAGKNLLGGLGAILKPVADGLHWAQKGLGDIGYEYGGPVGGAIGYAAIDGVLAFLTPGVRSSFGSVSNSALREFGTMRTNFLNASWKTSPMATQGGGIKFGPNKVPNKILEFTNLRKMDRRYIGEELGKVWPTKVKYLDEVGRQQYQLHIKNGKLFDNAGNLFDTSKGSTAFQGGTGKAIFVMDKKGAIYASNAHLPGKFHHSSFLSGQPVASAGELVVKNGVLQAVTRKSGHYTPTAEQLKQFLTQLNRNNVNLNKVNMGAGF